MMKWRKIRDKDQWFCDCCRKCSDSACCGSDARSWFKRLVLTTNRERDALLHAKWPDDSGPAAGSSLVDYTDDFALCDACWDAWSPKVDRAMTEALRVGTE